MYHYSYHYEVKCFKHKAQDRGYTAACPVCGRRRRLRFQLDNQKGHGWILRCRPHYQEYVPLEAIKAADQAC